MNFINAHGGVYAVLVLGFAIISMFLKFVADVFHALGKEAPSGIGKALSIVGKIIDFLNGARPAQPAPEAPKA